MSGRWSSVDASRARFSRRSFAEDCAARRLHCGAKTGGASPSQTTAKQCMTCGAQRQRTYLQVLRRDKTCCAAKSVPASLEARHICALQVAHPLVGLNFLPRSSLVFYRHRNTHSHRLPVVTASAMHGSASTSMLLQCRTSPQRHRVEAGEQWTAHVHLPRNTRAPSFRESCRLHSCNGSSRVKTATELSVRGAVAVSVCSSDPFCPLQQLVSPASLPGVSDPVQNELCMGTLSCAGDVWKTYGSTDPAQPKRCRLATLDQRGSIRKTP